MWHLELAHGALGFIEGLARATARRKRASSSRSRKNTTG
jgi:hypothetical protein